MNLKTKNSLIELFGIIGMLLGGMVIGFTFMSKDYTIPIGGLCLGFLISLLIMHRKWKKQIKMTLETKGNGE